jgi:hypothetical protein
MTEANPYAAMTDNSFAFAWPLMSDSERAAVPQGYERFRKLMGAVGANLPRADAPPMAPVMPPKQYRVLTAADLAAMPPNRWRVRGVLPEQGLAAVFGPSGSGKSFLVLDMLGAIAEGREWFGHRTRQCPVAYIALEGEAGIAQRVQAFATMHGQAPAELRFVAAPFALMDLGDVHALAAAIRSVGGADGIVAIDTLNRAAPGADENDSRDMGGLIAGAKDLQSALGGLVLLVHHTGKDATRGLRGHSSLHAALDAAISVTRDGERREWTVAKSKDGRDGATHSFKLEAVELGTDSDGEAVTSAVIAVVQSDASAKRTALPAGGTNQRVAWDALGEALRKAGDVRPSGAPDSLPYGRPAVTVEAGATAVAARLVGIDEKRRRERALSAIQGLAAKGLLRHDAGWLWCA